MKFFNPTLNQTLALVPPRKSNRWLTYDQASLSELNTWVLKHVSPSWCTTREFLPRSFIYLQKSWAEISIFPSFYQEANFGVDFPGNEEAS